MRARLGLAALGVVLAATFAAAYQAAPRGTPAPVTLPRQVSGSVIDGVTGAPVAAAEVVFTALMQRGPYLVADGPKVSRVTDAAGRFTVTGPPRGQMSMVVTKEGYLRGVPDQVGPSDTQGSGWFFVEVAPGEQIRNITVKLWRASTINGVVADEAGDPLVGESITLLQRRHYAGGAAIGLGWSRGPGRSDDRGRFRITDVPAGEYYLFVRPTAPVLSRGVVPTTPHQGAYYPGALRLADASVVRVGSGESLDGINITVGMAAARRAKTVAGRLSGPADRVASVDVTLIDADAPRELANYVAARVRSESDGSFKFASVAPGSYRLLAQSSSPEGVRALRYSGVSMANGPILWADEPVVVDAQDVTDVLVPLRTGARIRGRLVFEGGKAAPTSEELRATTIRMVLSHVSRGEQMPSVYVEGNGSFASDTLPPGFYSLTWDRPGLEGWHSVTSQPVELGASDLDVELRMLPRATIVAGGVSDAQGRPVMQARVLVFPRDPSKWGNGVAGRFVHQALVNAKGRFSQQPPPGDYLVAAIASVPANWSAPEFLETLVARATRATVTAGETVELSLRVQTAP